MRLYQNSCQFIAIWAINNFTTYKVLNVCIKVSSNGYRYYITNDFERLIEQKGSEIISIIITPILTIIGMHIGPTGFLEVGMPEIVFDIDKKILEELVIIKEIFTKLIFGRCVGLNWDDHCKLETAYSANYEHNMIEAKEEDPKAKTKQFKNK